MRTLRITGCLLLLCALGCRTNPNQVLLERDLRIQEDKIYQLQAMLEDAHVAREATIRENDSLKRELAGGDRGPGARSSSGDLPATNSPGRRRPAESPVLEPPKIELPESSDESSGAELPTVEMPAPEKEGAAVEGKPTELVINKRLTGGLDRDGQGGDDGLLVVVEPRDAAGNLIKTPGKISIVLLDPAAEGPAARVARWDFSGEEIPAHFRTTALGRGLHFELPWPSSPPQHRDVQLFVRYTADDGDKITTDAQFAVRLPSDPPRAAKGWSTADLAPGRAAAKSGPSSRVKKKSPSPDKRAAIEESEPDRVDAEGPPREPIREASRPRRPEWKPFR